MQTDSFIRDAARSFRAVDDSLICDSFVYGAVALDTNMNTDQTHMVNGQRSALYLAMRNNAEMLKI